MPVSWMGPVMAGRGIVRWGRGPRAVAVVAASAVFSLVGSMGVAAPELDGVAARVAAGLDFGWSGCP